MTEENSYLDDPLSPTLPDEPIPDYVLHVFGLIGSDTCPFVTVDEVLYAMQALYDYRVYLGLEQDVSDPLVMDLGGCSQQTQDAVAPIQELLDSGKRAVDYNEVMRDWFQMILDFVKCDASPCGNGLP